MTTKRTLATIMFTDMVGYTALMQEDEPLAKRKRDRHREVFELLHDKYDGQIIQYFGDGTLSIFASSVNAVACAIDMQQMLREPIEVPLRIGLHSGEITIEKDSVFGDAVNLASRIESFSVPGAVMVSDLLYDQVKNQPQFRFQSLGKFKLKNVQRPFEIYALTNGNLVVPEPEELQGKGQRLDVPKDNLPKVLTSFLGREKEIQELEELVKTRQLVTLTGPGGTGKTRLSIQVADGLKSDFPNGIFWVALASVTDVHVVPFAIAQQLDLKEDSLLSIDEVLIGFFRSEKALLILDNFEQIVGAAPLVERLAKSCPGLHMLVSSRIILQVGGEVEYPVPPLDLPKLNGRNTLERLKEVPSVALFAQRAGASRHSFQLTQDNIEAVAEICLRLDGLPLAIELAAARTKIFKPSALLSRLNKRLDILKGGNQFEGRHQTLRQTIAWSYDLLVPEERELFRRTSVFVGGSTIEAIEEVCGQNGLSDWDVVDGVMALVDKSLLQTEETEENMRFYMLETIREFAVEERERAANNLQLKAAHTHYFLQLAEEAASHLSGPEADDWSVRLAAEQANLRAAIDYAIQLDDMEKAYRIGLALRPFWGSTGRIMEGVQQLKKLLAVPVGEGVYERKLAVSEALGVMYFYTPDFEEAAKIFGESLDYWQKQQDKRKIGLALNNLGWALMGQGQYKKGIAISLGAKSIFEGLSEEASLIGSLTNLGWHHMARYRPLEAIPYFERTFQITQERQDRRRNTYALVNLSFSQYLKGDYELAMDQLLVALDYYRSNSDKVLVGYSMCVIGFICYCQGAYEECRQWGREEVEIGREIKSNFIIGCGFEHQALAAFGEGDLQEAKAWNDKAVTLFQKQVKAMHWTKKSVFTQAKIALAQGDTRLAVDCCTTLLVDAIEEENYLGFIPGLEIAARLALEQKDFRTAAILFFNARSLREKLQTPIFPCERAIYEDLLQQLQANLPEKTIILLQAQRMSEEELLSLAQQVIEYAT